MTLPPSLTPRGALPLSGATEGGGGHTDHYLKRLLKAGIKSLSTGPPQRLGLLHTDGLTELLPTPGNLSILWIFTSETNFRVFSDALPAGTRLMLGLFVDFQLQVYFSSFVFNLPSIRVFFNESDLHISWPKYWINLYQGMRKAGKN